MRLIYTSDGLVGVKFNRMPVKWYDSIRVAIPPILAHYSRHEGVLPLLEIEQEVRLAIDLMVKHKHDFAEFGMFGSFLYSSKEE